MATIKNDISWSLFALTGIAILLPLHFLSYSVLYTEGEVIQGLFVGLTALLAGVAGFLTIFSRKHAALLVVGVGGALLIWQSHQIRRWTMIHEEVIGIIRHVERVKDTTGSYPDTIEGYSFMHDELKAHISGHPTEPSNFHLSYFMNDAGTAYWYDSKDGFGYYPD
ncbi:MAG: hypothetical protein V4819_14295 [Verrucomicrobiota bacterium]